MEKYEQSALGFKLPCFLSVVRSAGARRTHLLHCTQRIVKARTCQLSGIIVLPGRKPTAFTLPENGVHPFGIIPTPGSGHIQTRRTLWHFRVYERYIWAR